MLRSIFGSNLVDATSAAQVPETKPASLLVIDGRDDYDWSAIFEGSRLADGRPVRVWQAGWEDILVHCDTYSNAPLCVDIKNLARKAKAGNGRQVTVQPDFLLVRNEVVAPSSNNLSNLNGFLFADVPAVNSLQSILMSCQRPAMQGQLNRYHKRLGDEFPVVPQHFASGSRALMYGYTFPAVVKVGSAHAGAGKMQIKDHHQMSDFRSVMQMMPGEHCMVEPFIKGKEDLRIQKIGRHYRAFRRRDISGEWKTNTGTAIMDEVPIEERWKKWADVASEMFGGLDILTVDAIVEEGTDKEYILEVNGTSSGLHPDCAAEDNLHIRDLVLERMNKELCS